MVFFANLPMPSAGPYDDYAAYKGWTGGPANPQTIEGYAIEFTRLNLPPGARVLDLGFGNGDLLRWARARGYDIAGAELQPELVDRARNDGFTVWLGDVTSVNEIPSSSFDAVLALDVFEHLDSEQLRALLARLSGLLKPGGKLLSRSPNGASPFGLRAQNGDPTHRQALTANTLAMLAYPSGLRMLWSGNAARPMAGSRSKLGKKLVYALRNCVEKAVSILYFNNFFVPLDQNLTCILQKPPTT